MAILETMGCGIVNIATRVAAIPEVIVHGETGFLVSVGDSDKLAERMEELLADDAKRKAFGEQAKKHAERMFLADHMTKRIEKLYLEARK